MNKKIGIVGGGQLGRMMAEANLRKGMGFEFLVLDPTENCPAAQINGVDQIVGGFKDEDKIRELAGQVDILTFEIELANSAVLKEIEKSGVVVAPSPDTLYIIQDKVRQKNFLRENGLPIGDFMPIETEADLLKGVMKYGFPAVLKATQDSYDGRGNYVLNTSEDISKALNMFEGRSLMLERNVPFVKEVSVIAARDLEGNIRTYPVSENEHVNGQLNMTIAPAELSKELRYKAGKVAYKAMQTFDGAGVFGIEMFVCGLDEILINEIAPRVHNSGHHTIEGNITCQFEQHLRAISGMTLGSTDQIKPVVMCNILGDDSFQGEFDVKYQASLPEGVGVHMYGKTSKPSRKLGHVTIPANDVGYAVFIKSNIQLVPRKDGK